MNSLATAFIQVVIALGLTALAGAALIAVADYATQAVVI